MISRLKYPTRILSNEKKEAVSQLNSRLSSNQTIFEKRHCPLCDYDKAFKLFTNDRFGISIQLTICIKCGLIYENPVLNDTSLSSFYSSNEYRQIYGGIDAISYLDRYRFDPKVVKHTNEYYTNESFFLFIRESNITFKTVLEIGAGGGWNSIPFEKSGYDYTGIEPNDQMVEIGKSRGINLRRGFVEDIQGTYDLIFLRHVLEHFKYPVDELKRLARHTSKLAIEVPGIITKMPSIQNAHLFYYSYNTIQSLCAKAGYRLTHYKQFEKNNFIMVIFEITEEVYQYKYSYFREKCKVVRIYLRFMVRFMVKQLIHK